MRARLILGPILIAALLGLLALDEALTRVEAPAWLWVLADKSGRFAPGILIVALGLLLSGRAGYELSRIFTACGIGVSARSCTFAAMAGVIASTVSVGWSSPMAAPHGGALLATAAGLVLFLTMLAYVRDKDPRGAAGAVAAALLSFVYCGVLLGFLLALRREHSIYVMLAVVLTIKASDIGAYFTGVAIGRHKLIEWLSKGKTWEGLAGGVIFSSAVCAGLAALGHATGTLPTLPAFTWMHGAAIGAALAVLGQLGDLSASVLKRDASMKDSGRVLPGFGGVLDVLDSLLIATPFAFWTLSALAVDAAP